MDIVLKIALWVGDWEKEDDAEDNLVCLWSAPEFEDDDNVAARIETRSWGGFFKKYEWMVYPPFFADDEAYDHGKANSLAEAKNQATSALRLLVAQVESDPNFAWPGKGGPASYRSAAGE